jgi:hypothetical protein
MLSKCINRRLGPTGVSDLIWDTGAADHFFEKLPANHRNVRTFCNVTKECNILLGGCSDHKLVIDRVFDVGCLKVVMLALVNEWDMILYPQEG